MRKWLLSVTCCLCVAILAGFSPPAWADALEDAITSGDLDGLREVVARENDVNRRLPPFQTTPLALAAVRGEAEMVRVLLDHGADPNIGNFTGAAALASAVRSCRATLSVVAELIAAGAELDHPTRAGITPLMLAIQQARPDFAVALIDAGADINAVNVFGDGVLNYAIYHQAPEIIAMVLDRGVDTAQLRRLYQTGRYYFPGFGQVRPNARPARVKIGRACSPPK